MSFTKNLAMPRASRSIRLPNSLILIITTLLSNSAGWAQGAEEGAPNPLASLALRNIGPAYPSGRISDFAFIGEGDNHYLVATSSGGLWETRNRGPTWTPLFDGQSSYALGVVKVAPTDQDIIWVGSGENNAQRSVGYGDGVYKSLDGGKTWENMGLALSLIHI